VSGPPKGAPVRSTEAAALEKRTSIIWLVRLLWWCAVARKVAECRQVAVGLSIRRMTFIGRDRMT
jgi:hypothetical protein